MKTRLIYLMLLVAAFSFTACDEDEPETVPLLTTAVITDVTAISAMGGGEITSDGNADVAASGLCWSSTNSLPTIDDDTTMTTVAMGSFTSVMEGLSPSTTYHVRAYATNGVGTAYGEVVDFTTGNAAPVAEQVVITGTVQALETLTATYAYTDTEGDPESGSTFQWYIATDAQGSEETAIAGATTLMYTLQPSDEFKYVRFGVTPVAAAGNTTGAEVRSAFVGPVAAEPTQITFTYNGQSVTYGILISPTTARRWLDRNLGAPNAPTVYNDYANLGDLFQWGRGPDGHQLLTRTATTLTTGTTAAVNGTTTTLSTSDSPGHELFILAGGTEYADWYEQGNNNLWQGVSGINNPCPAGFRIPTIEEWVAENIPNAADGFTKIKITFGGNRSSSTGSFSLTTNRGVYWSSTVMPPNATFSKPIATIEYSATAVTQLAQGGTRATGRLCRCIKN